MRRLCAAAYKKLHQVEFESPDHIAATARKLVDDMDAIRFSEDRSRSLVAARSILSAIDETSGAVAHAAALECREILRRRQVSEGDLLAQRLNEIPLLSVSQRSAIGEAHTNRGRDRSMGEFDQFMASCNQFKEEARSHLDGE